jgi:hypothetical protein
MAESRRGAGPEQSGQAFWLGKDGLSFPSEVGLQPHDGGRRAAARWRLIARREPHVNMSDSHRGRRWVALVGLAVVVVVVGCGSCSEPERRSGATTLPTASATIAPTDPVPSASTLIPTPTRRAGTMESDVTDAIRNAGRPVAGGTSPDGSAMLVYTPRPEEKGHPRPAAFRIFDKRGLVTAQGLVPPGIRMGDYLTVTSYRHGFVLADDDQRRAWNITHAGRASVLRFDRERTEPLPGDVFVNDAWIFRPSTQRVHRRVVGPGGAVVSHVDGHGVWWAYGKPENGRTVLYSLTPGHSWSKRAIGPFSDPHHGCVCDPSPGPHGRGPVLVVTGDELSHVSLDYGATWTTWNLSDSDPYRQTIARGRFPTTSALPDGRIVIGYSSTGYWVGEDATNNSFVQTEHYPKRELWLAGLTNELLLRATQVSPDGGQHWLPVG